MRFTLCIFYYPLCLIYSIIILFHPVCFFINIKFSDLIVWFNTMLNTNFLHWQFLSQKVKIRDKMGGENYWFLGILAAWLAALTIFFIFLYRRVAKVFSTEKNPSFDKILDQLTASVRKNGGEMKRNHEQVKCVAKEG